jgi:hypothetical protein
MPRARSLMAARIALCPSTSSKPSSPAIRSRRGPAPRLFQTSAAWRTRPSPLPGRRAPGAAGGSHGAAGPAPRARPCSGHPCAAHRRARPAGPSCGSPGRTARTRARGPPVMSGPDQPDHSSRELRRVGGMCRRHLERLLRKREGLHGSGSGSTPSGLPRDGERRPGCNGVCRVASSRGDGGIVRERPRVLELRPLTRELRCHVALRIATQETDADLPVVTAWRSVAARL